MKIESFPVQVAITFVAGFAIAAVPLFMLGSEKIIIAFGTGAILSTVNVLMGFGAIEYAFDKSFNTLLAAVLGGMGIRIGLLLLSLVLLIRYFGFHTVALVVSMLGFYVVYLVLEVLYIQRKVSHKHQS
ncbi:MAG: hypothetical protein ABI623_00205 [bacterium]